MMRNRRDLEEALRSTQGIFNGQDYNDLKDKRYESTTRHLDKQSGPTKHNLDHNEEGSGPRRSCWWLALMQETSTHTKGPAKGEKGRYI